jgi:hypothetical protein
MFDVDWIAAFGASQSGRAALSFTASENSNWFDTVLVMDMTM